MSLAIQALRYAAEPFFFSHAQDKNSPQLYSQVMQGYIIVACFILFAITANLDWLSYLFLRNPVYRTGIEIVPYLLLAYLWLGVYYNLSIWFKLINKTYYGTIITGVGAIITIAANILLVPYLGYWGSVWATVASYVSMSVLCYYQGQKYYPIPYQVGRGLVCIFTTIVLVPLLRNIAYTSWTSNVLTNLGVTFVFGFLLYKLIGYNKKI
jgi:O-antigen/teichoic acid export membrane protein